MTLPLREELALRALLRRPHNREDLDDASHSSNSPDVVFQLRGRGLGITTRMVPFETRSGRTGRYGVYHLDEGCRDHARSLLEAAKTAQEEPNQ